MAEDGPLRLLECIRGEESDVPNPLTRPHPKPKSDPTSSDHRFRLLSACAAGARIVEAEPGFPQNGTDYYRSTTGLQDIITGGACNRLTEGWISINCANQITRPRELNHVQPRTESRTLRELSQVDAGLEFTRNCG
jgi:hypothetical protein